MTDSAMISLDLSRGTIDPLPDGETDHHLTVVYLDKDLTDEQHETICRRAAAVATLLSGPMKGSVGGIGSFEPSASSDWLKPVYTIPDVPNIDALRGVFEDLNASEHTDYHPHVTLGYVDPAADLPEPLDERPVTFTHLSVHRGDTVKRFPFGGTPTSKGATMPDKADIVKALEEFRKDQPGLADVHVNAPVGTTADFGGPIGRALTRLKVKLAKPQKVPVEQPVDVKPAGLQSLADEMDAIAKEEARDGNGEWTSTGSATKSVASAIGVKTGAAKTHGDEFQAGAKKADKDVKAHLERSNGDTGMLHSHFAQHLDDAKTAQGKGQTKAVARHLGAATAIETHLKAGGEKPKYGNVEVSKDAGAKCLFCDNDATGDTDPPTCPDHKPMAKSESGLIVVKAAGALQFTFSPLYIPMSKDAHGDWATPEDLQQASWDLVKSGDRTINVQHIPGTEAGEWVELATWPWEHDAVLTVPGSEPRTIRMPANTPYMGVVWKDRAWTEVKEGRLRGLSMEGTAHRIVADLPGYEEAA